MAVGAGKCTRGGCSSPASAGPFPFASSIVFLSPIIDRLGYGRAMMFAFLGHTISAFITMTAQS